MRQKSNSFEFIELWLSLKKRAVLTGDFGQYIWFLREVQKEFADLYAEVKRPAVVSLVEQVLRINSCELKENIIKYKQ